MAPRKWPSFPFQISTNRVRDRLSGTAIVEIFQPPVEPQTKENGNEKKGKGRDDILLIYCERDQPFQSACGSLSIDMRDPLVKHRKFVGAQVYRASAILILDTSKVFPC